MIFHSRRTLVFAVGIGVVSLWAATTRADQIIVSGKSQTGGRVLSYDEGRLQVRSADGRTQAFWIDEIELLMVDRGGVFEDLNQAERFFSSGEPDKAAIRYERVARLGSEFWPDLAAARLVTAYDRAGQIDKAVLSFIRTVQGRFSGPSAAARLVPTNLPAKRDSKAARAIEQLDLALSQEPGEAVGALLEVLRYDILRQVGDERAAKREATVATLVIPEAVRSEPLYAVLRAAVGASLKTDATVERWAALDRAIRDCPDASLAGFLLVKGETLLRLAATRDDYVRASWPFLRVAVHRPDEPAAADGLLGGARALEAGGRSDYALFLFEQSASHPRAREETRRAAEEALTRLQAMKGSGRS